MNTISLISRAKKAFLAIAAVMLIMPFTLHAQKISFIQTSVVPAAEGYVKISNDANNNNSIKISIKNLAKIDMLDPQMKTYVVWMVTDKETTVNIGRIKSTRSLNVTFETVSSFQPIKIFITAEVNETTDFPGEKIVLTTNNFWEK